MRAIFQDAGVLDVIKRMLVMQMLPPPPLPPTSPSVVLPLLALPLSSLVWLSLPSGGARLPPPLLRPPLFKRCLHIL